MNTLLRGLFGPALIFGVISFSASVSGCASPPPPEKRATHASHLEAGDDPEKGDGFRDGDISARDGNGAFGLENSDDETNPDNTTCDDNGCTKTPEEPQTTGDPGNGEDERGGYASADEGGGGDESGGGGGGYEGGGEGGD